MIDYAVLSKHISRASIFFKEKQRPWFLLSIKRANNDCISEDVKLQWAKDGANTSFKDEGRIYRASITIFLLNWKLGDERTEADLIWILSKLIKQNQSFLSNYKL